MNNDNYFIVNSKVLPSVFSGVILAKEMLANGSASNTSQAVKMAGISRSAFYKYRDFVFKYKSTNGNTVNLSATLSDRAGVFSAMTTILYENGANIITVNQGIPINGTAAVTITVDTENVKISLEELLKKLNSVSGIITIKEV